MNVLEKILEELEERVNYRKRLVRYEKKNGTVTDVVRNQGALEELVVVEKTICSHMDDGKDTNVPSNWIPCSERLPNEEEFIKAYCRNIYAAEFIVMIKGATLPTTLYFKNGSWTDMEGNYYNVVAWQPLPEPYKGEEVAGE